MRRKFEKNEKEKIEEIPGRKRTLNLSKEWEEQYIAKAERREKELFGETDPEKYDESEEETETAYQELIDSLRFFPCMRRTVPEEKNRICQRGAEAGLWGISRKSPAKKDGTEASGWEKSPGLLWSAAPVCLRPV